MVRELDAPLPMVLRAKARLAFDEALVETHRRFLQGTLGKADVAYLATLARVAGIEKTTGAAAGDEIARRQAFVLLPERRPRTSQLAEAMDGVEVVEQPPQGHHGHHG